MHVVFRESHGLEETETPTDLGQSPADLVVLSFSDSDLAAFAAGWHCGGGPQGCMPTLRLANIAALKHPLSVDTYVEQTLSGARGILIRLIGGIPYWPYGIQHISALAAERNIPLAVLPADGRVDEQLDAVSTLPVAQLRHLARLCDTGGGEAALAALTELARAAGLANAASPAPSALASFGAWCPDDGVCCLAMLRKSQQPLVLVTFYRAYLTSHDTAPIAAMIRAMRARGFASFGLFAPSLKAPDAARWIAEQMRILRPVAIVNATAFSSKGADGASPLDAAEVPVFQIALSTSNEAAWVEAERGLSPADLAMHVVLPEVDGRIFAGVASFKESQTPDPDLEFSRYIHRSHSHRIAAIADRIKAWVDLAARPASERRPALVLSTYPGRDWNMAHAVGLDALASAEAILEDLRQAGYAFGDEYPDLTRDLQHDRITWNLSEYEAALARLPDTLRCDLVEVWGRPDQDPACENGAFRFAAIRCGNSIIALQPERGNPQLREDEYHDLGRTPRHGYVAFYLWLRQNTDAMIHIGAHGTLEWLPGKSVALSEACWPEALTGALPVLYPFIVNDPGEAAQAKRRIAAVTLGHIPPPLRTSRTPDRLVRLETLLDEFSNADGLDPKRRDRLQGDIRTEAQALGVETDLGLDRASSTAEAITRIDRFVCDIKESQFGDGLHIWGRAPQDQSVPEVTAAVQAERMAIPHALDGHRVAAGPSGSPYRGRRDVLPTGRNLFTTDPRAVPTRAAYAQGVKLAEELVRRHLQDEGDWPRGLVVNLWGSATMRTAGEEFAMALHLLGVRPVWDKGSGRVSGIEILPLAELDRPRIDVTLRISGLFRDVFPGLARMFSQAVRALAGRDEAADFNPYRDQSDTSRVYGPAPGRYGLGMGDLTADLTDESRQRAGEAWLGASSWAMDGDQPYQDMAGLRARVDAADAFVHLQDLPETDLLLAADYAAHEAGFAAAQSVAGGKAALYHIDNTDPARPQARKLREEIARVVQARAANPDWLAGMKRHGFRGAAEIAMTLDHMAAFAHLGDAVAPHLFDIYHEATLGDPDISAFLRDANPAAYRAMQDQFAALMASGLWNTRRNSIRAAMEARG